MGKQLRRHLDLAAGTTSVQLCGLTPGNSYSVFAVGATYGQQATVRIEPSISTKKASQNLESLSEQQNAVRFTALSECMEIPVFTSTEQAEAVIPVSFSVGCDNCPRDDTWKNNLLNQLDMTILSVTGGIPAESLIGNTLIDGGCFDVSNVTSTGVPATRGTFTNGGSSIGIENGIVLCTGDVGILPGPNDAHGTGGSFGIDSPDDPDLATLTDGNQYDLNSIEFDFTPTASTVKFDFVFGSEEYCEFVGSQYNDVFGFFISGPGISGTLNIGVIPGTSTPVAVNNVNYLINNNLYINNTDFPPCENLPALAPNDCQLDGWTQAFSAQTDLIPCQTYHIKLAIANVADAFFTSAVFLKAASFEAGPVVNAQVMYTGNLPYAVEGCNTGAIKFSRGSGDNSQDLSFNFDVAPGSTAMPGVDFGFLGGNVTIPAGENDILIPVMVYQDGANEGEEQILFSFDKACSCTQPLLSFLIHDNDFAPLSVNLPDLSVCGGNAAVLTPVVSGGAAPYSYHWNTGATTSSITAPGAGNYTVTVIDQCGAGLADSAKTLFVANIQQTKNLSFCSGSSVTIDGVVYSQSATVLDTLTGINGACDTVVTYLLQMLPPPTHTETILLCPGVSINIGGSMHSAPATVVDTIAGTNGGCDTIATYILQLQTPAPSTVGITCPGNNTVAASVPSIVNYNQPAATSDCPCPGMTLTRTSGLASGSVFPTGITHVCYTATDACGNSASCCFTVNISEAGPCDVKVLDCMKFELLDITKNAAAERTYRIRVTNTCTNKMIYTVFQLPNSEVAVEPANNSIYTSPDNRSYEVRNPNTTPFYSIRFKSIADGIANGESDIFEYTLPPQIALVYIHAGARLESKTFMEVYLNTFYCPVNEAPAMRSDGVEGTGFRIFPNPTNGTLFADLSNWKDQQVHLLAFDARGQHVLDQMVLADGMAQEIPLPKGLADGLYVLEVLSASGNREVLSFVVSSGN